MRFHAQLPVPPILAVLALLIGLSGCFPPSPAVSGVQQAQWRAALKSRRGSIVAVNVWATWCKECVEDFAAFVELRPRYRDRGVQFLTLSLDEVGPAKDVGEVESFLRMQASGLSNYILLEPLADAMDMLEIGGLPAVLVYRPDGSVAYCLQGDEFENRVQQGDIEAALQNLLPEPLPRPAQ